MFHWQKYKKDDSISFFRSINYELQIPHVKKVRLKHTLSASKESGKNDQKKDQTY